jgi:hypothetical protein
MSKRLQVLIDEPDLDEIRGLAKRERLTVADWVRRALDEAKRRRSSGDAAKKVASIRAAVRHEFPAGDIDSMLEEINRGVVAGPSAPPPAAPQARRAP